MLLSVLYSVCMIDAQHIGEAARHHRLRDLDIVFISYDEPLAAEYHDRLQASWPREVHWVHGIMGVGRAYKRAAHTCKTSRFIVVNGSTITTDDLADMALTDVDDDVVCSFRARNVVNGLEYGSGGVEVWPRTLALRISTEDHATDPNALMDFRRKHRRQLVDRLGSFLHCNQSPLQAFRTGYREAVKLCLDGSRRPADWRVRRGTMTVDERSRLMVWMSVGADVGNGSWAIYGARRGFFDLWCDDLCLARFSDYDWFHDVVWPDASHDDPVSASVALGYRIEDVLGVHLPNLTSGTSRWFKSVYVNPT